MLIGDNSGLVTSSPNIGRGDIEIYGRFPGGTYVQYPDSSDCGLQKVPCFTFDDLPSSSTEDSSKFDEANSWGKCENGMQSEGIGGTCAAYPLRQTYEEGKAINVPVGRGWAGPDNTYPTKMK